MKKIFLVFVVLFLTIACSKKENEPAIENKYDKTALLTNWADNIIIPSFINYQLKVTDLNTVAIAFTVNPNQSTLNILRTAWIDAYKAYQYVSIYNFGKSEEIGLKESINIFPIDVVGINANITSGNYNLYMPAQYKTQGFPGLDYLINGLANNDIDILALYTTNGNAANYKKYLKDITYKIKNGADQIVVDWNTAYKNTYITNTGTSVTGAVNVTANEFVKNLEKDIRTAKIDIPAGLFSNGTLFANKVEGFYKKDISKMLLIESLKASQDFYNGKHFNSTINGESLKSYLDFLNATRNNQKLSDIINNQYASIFTVCNLLDNSLATQINTDNSKMLNVNSVIQQNVVYTKLDMMQALNISIDYVDGDGD